MLGKGGKERIVPLDEALLEAIDGERDWLLGCRVRPDWLSNKQRPVWQALGLPDEFHLYMGRHWYATTLLRRGATIRQVQVLLGHASVRTTQGYTQVTAEELSWAVGLLPAL